MKLSLNFATLLVLASSYVNASVSGNIKVSECEFINNQHEGLGGYVVQASLNNGWSWKSGFAVNQNVCSDDGVMCFSNLGSSTITIAYANTQKSVQLSSGGSGVCPSGNHYSTDATWSGSFSF